MTSRKVRGARTPFEIVWDDTGIAHVFADNVADAYRGMGYAAGSERLWQIHQSTAYANCQAAELLGERFVAQDALQLACNVNGRAHTLPDSDGDWIVDAYLDGLNSVIEQLTDVPPEFAHAGATPRSFTRADVAARYRFTCWFQHKSWTEKMAIGRLMATHGIDWFRHHVLHLSDADEHCIAELNSPLQQLPITPFALAYPEASHLVLSGSNNWAVTGNHTASGQGMLATDPHQPHTIPNTFFYVHLHTPDWDVFGAAFPGVPYFMMGTTRDLAWGLTTGMVDCYDVYIERLNNQHQYQFEDAWHDVETCSHRIDIKGGDSRDIEVARTRHGPLLERLSQQLDLTATPAPGFATALHWSLTDVPTSAGALARLPLATSAEEFGHFLFEDDVCPLVNNIICVDRHDGLRRFIATTTPARSQVSGTVPLPGWQASYEFPLSTETDLTVEVDPPEGFSLTANNDTMAERGAFYIHNFPVTSDRADRIEQLLQDGSRFTVDDFKRAQLDLLDLRAAGMVPELLEILSERDSPQLKLASQLLSNWDYQSRPDAAAPCIFYPFLDRLWARKFMREVFDDPVIRAIPNAAPALSMFDIKHFLTPGSPWLAHREKLVDTITKTMIQVVDAVTADLGPNAEAWQWGQLHQIQFAHRLHKYEPWRDMSVGPDPLGGSATTLAMAMHMGPGPGRTEAGQIACRVYHGPAFRLVVDLADPDHVHFVIAGGNGGKPGSRFATNQYPLWRDGEYHIVSLRREEITAHETWQLHP